MTRYVYRFGGGASDGEAGNKNLLGGKGANLAEMASIGLPVPPGFTISTEMCALYYAEGESFPDSVRAEVRGRPRPYRAPHRQELRRPGRSAARLGPLRRPGVDAGNDGHRPQPRPQRPDRRGARRRLRRPALRLGQLPPLHPDVFRRRPRTRPRRLRGSAGDRQGGQGRPSRHRSRGARTGAASPAATRRWSRSSSAGPFPRTSTSSSGARSARCSAPGSRTGRRPTGA